ncbi:MAG: hypothetical protein SOR40_04010 [Rothia sp. (in: high G+C Gram-positive bacteria)]|nr:hypothetical protein [Rothia sp. (in: high G+C Gram-positive bacteria)]
MSSSTRRTALSIAFAGLSTCLVAGATTSYAADSDLPEGLKRGRILEYVEGHPIYEVVDQAGNPQGVSLSASDTRTMQASLRELDATLNKPHSGNETQSVVPCAIAIAWFVGQTLFPAARIANLAWRLAGLVRRYGAHTVARIWRGARGLTDRTAQQEIIELAGALAGVGGLEACGIHF